MQKVADPTLVQDRNTVRRTGGASRSELSQELAGLLRSSRQQLHNMQHGLNRVMTLEPLTTVKDLIIVGDGPAAEEIFQYCEDQTVRGYRFRGVFHDQALQGPLGERQMGSIEAAKAFATQKPYRYPVLCIAWQVP